MLKQHFAPAPPVKVLLNIGALLDIPTGSFIKGAKGENILLGGLGSLTGISGDGNKYKSTIEHYMMLSAANRLFSTVETSMSTYDTEINIHESRLQFFASKFKYLKDRDIIKNGEWVVTDKTIYYGDKWFEVLKDFLKSKLENYKQLECTTPFLSRDKVTPLKIMVPTFSEVDSLTDFITSDVVKMQDENELGESGGNTIHMRSGLAKARFMMEVPILAGAANHFVLLTAQIGKELMVASGPHMAPPAKKLQYMKQGDKIKGVTDKFFFLLNNSWQTVSAAVLVNAKTKSAEYPKNSDDNNSPDTDLNLVTLRQLRSKSGPSGYNIELVVSQYEGVLPELTEFHYIKGADRFGLTGTLQSYSLDLYPDVNLSRTTIRSKIDDDLKLKRALNITSELCQMHHFYRHLKETLCTTKEMYESLKQKGYDWDFILTHTRGWWAPNDEKHPLLFLSTMDLVLMTKGEYFPYWMNEDKTVKKEYLKYIEK